MPLTPVDVRNVAFSKPPIGKRGYNEDEVDTFLDLVGAELARLIEQTNDLRNLVAQRDRQLRAAQVGPGRSLRPLEPPRSVAGSAWPPVTGRQSSPDHDHDAPAAKVLGLAQQIADRLTGEAKEEANGMLGEARTRADQLLAGARAKADGMVNDARARAESLLSSARNRAETLELQSREKAATLERDAARKHNEIIGSISQERSALERKVDELRAFEVEYRIRVKTYLESQLRELDLRAFGAPVSAAYERSDPSAAGSTDPSGHRADPQVGRAADVARLPARNGKLNMETIDRVGRSEMQWEPAV